MTTTNFNIRLDKELRDKAFPVFERYGLSASQAFKLFLTQVAETNQIPLSFDYAATVPNAKTAQAIRQGRDEYHTGQLKGYQPEEFTQAVTDLARD